MVLGMITAIAACPAIIGTTEAVRQGQNQNKREAHRGRKSNLHVSCSDPSSKARDINGGTVVIRDGKVRRDISSFAAQGSFHSRSPPPYQQQTSSNCSNYELR